MEKGTDGVASNTSAEAAHADIVTRLARLARLLRNSLRELGFDEAIRDAAQAIPDARDRLRYVASMTERAANRVLDATEAIGPLQDGIVQEAHRLKARLADEPASAPLSAMQDYLRLAQANAAGTKGHVRDIVVAQDFQDLTGQMILKMLDVIDTLEKELLQVLLENVPAGRREPREAADERLAAGADTPAAEAVAGQDEVDDLLSSLGL